MTSRREFIRSAAFTSLIASIPLTRASAASPPSPPSPLVIDGQPSPVSAAGFYDDPFSSYPTWYVSPTGTNPPAGSHQPPGHTYRNYEVAMVDVFWAANLGPRRIVIRAGTYSPMDRTRGGYFPFGGSGPNSQYVVQGDPTLSPADVPVIDGGASSLLSCAGFFCIGNAGGPLQASTGHIQWITIRKLEMRNSCSDHVYMHGGSADNIVFEYLYCHSNIYPQLADHGGPTGASFTPPVGDGPGAAGALGISATDNSYNNMTVRYCKFANFSGSGQAYGRSLNCVPYETYGSSNVTFDHNLFDTNYAGIRLKLYDNGVKLQSGLANNYTITNNIFKDCFTAMSVGTGATYFNPPNNWLMSNNLFYGTSALGQSQVINNTGVPYAAAVRATGTVFANNTISEDYGAGFSWMGGDGIVFRDNVSLVSSAGAWQLQTWDPADPGIGAAGGATFSTLDYNAYANNSTWRLERQQAVYDTPLYACVSWAQWTKAYTSPRAAKGAAPSSAPLDLSTLAGSHNPDAHGSWIPSHPAPFNTVPGNFPNLHNRDYTIAAGSPLLTASSTGGRIGYDPKSIGPGW